VAQTLPGMLSPVVASLTVPLTEPAVTALRAWLRDGRPRLVSGQAPVAAAS